MLATEPRLEGLTKEYVINISADTKLPVGSLPRIDVSAIICHLDRTLFKDTVVPVVFKGDKT